MNQKRLFLLAAIVFTILVLPVQAEVLHHSHTANQSHVTETEIRSYTARLQAIFGAADVFDRVKIQAADVRNYADRLESYASFPNRLSVESHADKLTQIREGVNNLAPDLEILLDSAPALLPRQQLALQYILDDAMKLSRNAEAAIEYLNANPNHLWGDEYESAVSAMYNRADRIISAAKMSQTLLDAGKYLEKLNREESFDEFAGL